MGFFNKFLKGLGFEDEEEEPAKPKVKQKKQKVKNTVIATYDLGKYSEDMVISNEQQEQQKIEKQETVPEEPKQELDFELVKVKNQLDVQKVVQKISLGKKILINTEGLLTQDLTRSLDFLSGAVYALNLNMQKVDDYLYLINKKPSQF